ncbi:MAG: AMP-binding protein, partial [Myxococcales bacterium]|nr:AMP-binding protein [Myxococcales bacterium]
MSALTGLLARGGSGLAFAEADRELSWDALGERARAVAAALAGLGLAPGDRVATFVDAGLDAVVLTAALLRAGLVQVPVNTRYRDAEIAHVLTDSGAAALVTAPGSVAEVTARALADGGPRVVSAASLAASEAPPGSPSPETSAAGPDAASPALIVYTSGTTGRSKGVVLSHGALAANVGAVTGLWRFSPDDVLVLALPLFHVHGLGLGVLGTLLNGNACVVLPHFSPAAVAAAMAERGGTVFMGVPTMYHQLLAWLDEDPARAEPLRRARLFTAGSAALPARDLARFEAHTGHRILERYGMTETGFTLSNPYDGERRAGAVGRPVPGYEARVVGDDGGPVAPGEPGALEVRGDGLMTGYWRNEAATRDAFTADGWFKTG